MSRPAGLPDMRAEFAAVVAMNLIGWLGLALGLSCAFWLGLCFALIRGCQR